MSSYCLSSGRAYGFDLEIAKPSSPSPARSSSPSSTLSESSNAPGAVSFKKARAPRKRPNQTYNEAAALLATVYPTVFSAAKLSKQAPFASFPESDDLLLPLPVLSDAAFLIHKPRQENLAADAGRELKHRPPPADWECASPASNVSWEPSSLDPFDDEFDAESILDEEIGGGIDSIIGDAGAKSSTDGVESTRSNPCINPLLRYLIGNKLGAKFHLGLGYGKNLRRALKNSDDREWWRAPAVPVRDINSDFKPLATLMSVTTSSKKKKKKKKKVDKVEEEEAMAVTANSAWTPSPGKLKAGLGLKLSQDHILRSWSGNVSIFSDGPHSPNSSADALARLTDIDLFLDAGTAGGVREASVLRYKEKRQTRLFSKKIRYEVRKTNADRRPRMKGRFVRRPFEETEAENHGSHDFQRESFV
ncbi:protein CHLOROPLAST IMPORT APPARATUS 2-like [Zingiber officinale]|uniref:protein CHLOROPLAST IMPORT APPARATUS 2-like n=1 Tax=Zingiber officinale TaxID=94328 RepID=UPI001C4CABCD|nr:protein CHLOROPLAST IMPORT APPARATUS 2-like [Zingiber officinale]